MLFDDVVLEKIYANKIQVITFYTLPQNHG